MLDSEELDTHHGMPHPIKREKLYEDCIDLYINNMPTLLHEYPFHIAYEGERAIDTGGVSRDLFSAFWEDAYVKDFDGSSTYVPSVHPHSDISRYSVLGAIMSHGFMSSGILPNRLAFPVIASTLLGTDVAFPDSVIVDSFTDHVSSYESTIFREALTLANSESPNSHFSPQLNDALLSVLSIRGCREMPTPSNIQRILLQVAQYELLTKPLSALLSLSRGVPKEYHSFLRGFSVARLYELYKSLNATRGSVIAMIAESDSMTSTQSRILGYLKTFIGNLEHRDLRNFLRFVTRSSVMINKKIRITFNALSGLVRRPISHTCSCTLELPLTYPTYPEFAQEFITVLRSEVAWPMEAM